MSEHRTDDLFVELIILIDDTRRNDKIVIGSRNNLNNDNMHIDLVHFVSVICIVIFFSHETLKSS